MIPYHEQLSRVFNTPLLATPQKAATIGAYLLSRADARMGRGTGAEQDAVAEEQYFKTEEREDGSKILHAPRASRFHGQYLVDENGKPSLYRVKDRVAILQVIGSLVNRGAWVGASSGLVSYEGFIHQITTAANDSRVDSILLDMQSPGGEAVGCFEAAAAVRKAAAIKPVTALVNGMACSAAYAIASGATRRVTTPSGISGSIGVVLMHLDFSVYLHNEGVKPTLIHAGAHKVDGNPYEPLPKEVRDDLQAEVDQFYSMFVACVAEGTGLTDEAIRATEARTYIGTEAVKVGLMDEVATIEEVLAAMTAPKTESGEPVTVIVGSSTKQEKDMDLLKALKALVTGAEAETSTETPAHISTAPTEAEPLASEEPEAGRGGAPSLVHFGSVVAGADGARVLNVACATEPYGEVTATDVIDDVSCADCLRAELASRDERAKVAALEAEKEAQANAEKERTARIEAAVEAFAKSCANVGRDATAALVARYRSAQESGDSAAIGDLETIAASFAPPTQGRLPETGPSAEDIARRGTLKKEEIGAEAAKRVKAQGITERSPKWGQAYSRAVQELTEGINAA